ncbi:MAG TPA: hypothetical protein EYP55_11090 [Anaerolineae bacterium]|nr:hypothetical protein [Anaerolineae bacterium]
MVSLFAMPGWKTYTPDGSTELAEVFDLLRASGKPVLFCVEGNEELVREARTKIEGEGFPVYSQVTRAVSVLSYLNRYAHFVRRVSVSPIRRAAGG